MQTCITTSLHAAHFSCLIAYLLPASLSLSLSCLNHLIIFMVLNSRGPEVLQPHLVTKHWSQVCRPVTRINTYVLQSYVNHPSSNFLCSHVQMLTKPTSSGSQMQTIRTKGAEHAPLFQLCCTQTWRKGPCSVCLDFLPLGPFDFVSSLSWTSCLLTLLA